MARWNPFLTRGMGTTQSSLGRQGKMGMREGSVRVRIRPPSYHDSMEEEFSGEVRREPLENFPSPGSGEVPVAQFEELQQGIFRGVHELMAQERILREQLFARCDLEFQHLKSWLSVLNGQVEELRRELANSSTQQQGSLDRLRQSVLQQLGDQGREFEAKGQLHQEQVGGWRQT